MCEYKGRGALAKDFQAAPFLRSHVDPEPSAFLTETAPSSSLAESQQIEASGTKTPASKVASSSQLPTVPVVRYLVDRWKQDARGRMIVAGWCGALAVASIWGIYSQFRIRAELRYLRGEKPATTNTRQQNTSDNSAEGSPQLAALKGHSKKAHSKTDSGSDERGETEERKKDLAHKSKFEKQLKKEIESSEMAALDNGCVWRVASLASPRSWTLWSPSLFASGALAAVWWHVTKQSLVNDSIGHLGQLVVSKDWSTLPSATMQFAAVCVDAALALASAQLCQRLLAQSLRRSLSASLLRKYGGHVIHVVPRVSEMHSRMTRDVADWSQKAAKLLVSSVSPLLKLVICSRKMTARIGTHTFLKCVAYFVVSGMWARKLLPTSGGRAAMLEAECEALYSGTHERMVEFAEEIHFLRGISAELALLRAKYDSLSRTKATTAANLFVCDCFHTYFVRYLGVLVSFVTLLPVADSSDCPTEFLLNSLHDLVSLGISLRDLALNFSAFRQLVGTSARIEELNTALTEERNAAASSFLSKFNASVVYTDEYFADDESKSEELTDSRGVSLKAAAKTVAVNAIVCFTDVSISTPQNTANGSADSSRLLVKGLNLNIERGHNLMITGPNGAGKSSILRVLCGAWRHSGHIRLSQKLNAETDIMFLPQRVYLVPRLSIKEQLLYPWIGAAPHCHWQTTDSRIVETLTLFGLGHIAADESGSFQLTAPRSACFWQQLSPGQKQCVALCRVLLRKPVLAFLDESCCAVSEKLTHAFYRKTRDANISVVSITHDSSVLKYHSSVLRLTADGKGTYQLETR